MQPIPRAFAFNRRALEEIEKLGILAKTEQIEILTAEDAEIASELYRGGVLLSDILSRKLAHEHKKAVNDSFKNYLFFFEPETLREAVRPSDDPDHSPWFQNVLSMVRKWMGMDSE